ncbi:MFS transporter [Xanthomonas translucens]|uniref:MFS transporter n=1 Tax=Xanthomonas campestris pv. translucens TaxID=343 RepID=UPI0002A7B5DB|nr:MFS transporter [Xanthomonas translucens]AKK69428.1 major facilitator transporter [Xanthomonas translucens pv. undulosa]AVY68391.1 major facilitator transporter [Xanthomonas translucens pv. undulosa]ELQ14680.1 putative major facilitator superfamily transmembrane transport protein [Xanthomonas translucens DAR61454]MBC3971277.1 MHS family MFS transporter [Xanthomonas translucens pv. undulosa]MCT8271896.1 MHS family MFS transporter [Xanthomonas translucens pv. undulosa]
MSSTAINPSGKPLTQGHKKVIFASSLGTVFEWYDFYLYGSLAAIIAKQFFSGVNETTGFIFALLAFAAGFAVRPFGAAFFGSLGDRIGRKYTFLVTIVLMGLSTFIVGILPNYASIGMAAPIILIVLRLVQGLALGGEYGGAATYVAEHAPPGKRGLYTSFIQTTATLGLFLSLLVILGTRMTLGTEVFEDWGWRIPFMVSIVLLGVSVWIRMQLSESPLFQQMKSEGKGSKQPFRDSLKDGNFRLMLLVLLGATAGQAVVWYGGQFYSLFFLTQTLKVDGTTANLLIAAALALATPFFVIFGWLSDKIGRKKIILAGCLLAALTYFPIFKGLTHFANPAVEEARQSAPATVVADPATCSFQFDPIGKAKFTNSCDVAAAALAKAGVPYAIKPAAAGSLAQVSIGGTQVPAYEAAGLGKDEAKAKSDAFGKQLKGALIAAGYPEKADPARINKPMTLLLLWILVIYVTMVYGPIAAYLVELFPTRIRYTSMSLPYHIGNGWFGGFLPTISFALVAATGNMYYGLWYPIGIALMTFVIGLFFLRETKDVDITK